MAVIGFVGAGHAGDCLKSPWPNKKHRGHGPLPRLLNQARLSCG